MRQHFPAARGATLGLGAALVTTLGAGGCATQHVGSANLDSGRAAYGRFELLATASLPSELEFEGTLVGGLSGIFWSGSGDRYLAVSDDASQYAPARVYELAIERAGPDLAVEIRGVTLLHQQSGATYRRGTIDPEGIAPADGDGFWLSSEGNAQAKIGPTVTHYDDTGLPLRSLAIPEHYEPDSAGVGVRANQAFESLTRAPGTTILFTALEGALHTEGPAADVGVRTPARLLRYDLADGLPPVEYRYWAEAVTRRPALPGAFRTAGLVELLALDHETLLALERSFGVGTGYTVRLYLASLAGATPLPAPDEIDADPQPISKELLLDFAELGISPRNLEGMTFGPPLPDGRRSVVVVADNNFRDGDRTQILLLAFDAAQ